MCVFVFKKSIDPLLWAKDYFMARTPPLPSHRHPNKPDLSGNTQFSATSYAYKSILVQNRFPLWCQTTRVSESEQQLRACIPSGSISHGTSESLALPYCCVQGLVSSLKVPVEGSGSASGSQCLWCRTKQPLLQGEHRGASGSGQVEVWLLHLLAV